MHDSRKIEAPWAISSLVWVRYLNRSRRVRLTFEQSQPSSEHPYSGNFFQGDGGVKSQPHRGHMVAISGIALLQLEHETNLSSALLHDNMVNPRQFDARFNESIIMTPPSPFFPGRMGSSDLMDLQK